MIHPWLDSVLCANTRFQWLKTGRNSCPLCRALGVEVKATEESTGEGPSSGVGTTTT